MLLCAIFFTCFSLFQFGVIGSHHITLCAFCTCVFFCRGTGPYLLPWVCAVQPRPFHGVQRRCHGEKALGGIFLTSRCIRARGDPYGLANTRCVFVARLGRSEACGVGSRGSKSIVGSSTIVWPAPVGFCLQGRYLSGRSAAVLSPRNYFRHVSGIHLR